MRVLTFHTPGEPEQLTSHHLPSVTLSRGHVRIAVSAIGLNFADIVQISGAFQIPAPTPPVPGFELCGILIEIADDVLDLTVGQRVMALVSWGAYTDELVVPAAHVLPVPAGMDDVTAAAFPVSYAAAHVSLCHRGRLRPGETALVTGPTGNVGSAALQVARAVGATVIAVDRSGTFGPEIADHVIDPATEDVASRVRQLTDGRGVDLALDLIGGDLTAALMLSLAWEGRLVIVGMASGVVPTVSLLDVLVGNIAVIGQDIAHYAARDIPVARAALQECLEWYEAGLLQPRSPQRHSFTGVSAALRQIADGTTRHKLVLDLTR